MQQLRAMLERNKGNKGLVPQIEQKLREAQAEVAAAQAHPAGPAAEALPLRRLPSASNTGVFHGHVLYVSNQR